LKSKELCGIDADEYKVLKMLPSSRRFKMKPMHRLSKACSNNKLSTPIARQAVSTKQAFRNSKCGHERRLLNDTNVIFQSADTNEGRN
jgi:hypothetical protein